MEMARLGFIAVLLSGLVLASLCAAQTNSSPHTTVRHRRVAVENDAQQVSPQVQQAEAFLAQSDYAQAEKLLQSAVAASPSDFRAWFDLGTVYDAANRKPAAIDAFRKSVAAKSDLFESNLNLGLLLAASGDLEEAASQLRATTALKPSNPAAYRDSMGQAWLALAQVLHESKKDEEALLAYQKVVEFLPQDSEPHVGAAQILEQKGELRVSQLEYKKAIELDAKSVKAWAGLTNVLLAEKQLLEAESALRQYVKLDPQNASAHVQLGRVLESTERYDEAQTELETAIKIDANHLSARRELAALTARQKKYDEAESQYTLLVQQAPNDAGLHEALGAVLMQERKFAHAETEMQKALRLSPDLSEAYGNLATVASEVGDYQLALNALDARVHYLPESAATYFLRATLYDHLKNFTVASSYYRRFLETDNGTLPNQEWQARHRLIAIEPMK
jgi:Flp pilus assembly protein TadD